MSDQQDFERAALIAAEMQLSNELERAVEAGKAKHGARFDVALDRLKATGLDVDALQQIAATDNPGDVLFTLGDRPEELHRLANMSPQQRRIELVKMGLSQPKPKPAATAPSAGSLYDGPTRTYSGDRRDAWQGAKGDSSDNDSKWYAERRRQKEASVGRPWSPKKS
jgi:hypothetical protein